MGCCAAYPTAVNGRLAGREGSLYPTLYRLEFKGWIRSEWRITENDRRAKFYHHTPKGKKQLEAELATRDRLSSAIGSLLGRVAEAF
jgi:PadR family transcriptional regulator PadR